MSKFLLSVLISFAIAVIVSPLVIKITRRLKFGQNILHYVESHADKQGTPTMGGIIFIFSTIVTSFMFYDADFRLALIALAIFFGYGLLGFLDDFLKIHLKRNLGLKAYQKVIGQVGLAVIVSVYLYLNPEISGVNIPFTQYIVQFGLWIIPYAIFVMLAASNSVNLTDGLDGLAGGVSVVSFGCLAILLSIFCGYTSVSGAWAGQIQGLIVVCGSIVGGLLAFLCFNSYRAKIFMGDTGSLSLGGLLAVVSLLGGQTLYIPIFGLMFVLSTVSVIIQVLHFKRTHKRVFLMAPLHHHFEKKGCNESKIVAIYIIVTILLSSVCILPLIY